LRFGWKLSSYSSFNVTRSRPKKHDLPQSTLELIHEKNGLDMELYECGKQIFEAAVAANTEAVARLAEDLRATRTRSQGSFGGTMFSLRAAARKAINRAYSAV